MGESEKQLAKLEQQVEQHTDDIKQLKEVTFGIPQRFDRVEDALVEFSKDFKEFLNKAEGKYQSKEMCEMCREGCREKLDTRLTALEEENKKQRYAIFSMGAAVIGFLIKTYILKV